ncbi:hypothetical protein C8F01DRAFT_1080572 [Mycena amicta]|nr:hypothetical protein C8F01DRAFT_1080572 [Mycena amicta]
MTVERESDEDEDENASHLRVLLPKPTASEYAPCSTQRVIDSYRGRASERFAQGAERSMMHDDGLEGVISMLWQWRRPEKQKSRSRSGVEADEQDLELEWDTSTRWFFRVRRRDGSPSWLQATGRPADSERYFLQSAHWPVTLKLCASGPSSIRCVYVWESSSVVVEVAMRASSGVPTEVYDCCNSEWGYVVVVRLSSRSVPVPVSVPVPFRSVPFRPLTRSNTAKAGLYSTPPLSCVIMARPPHYIIVGPIRVEP